MGWPRLRAVHHPQVRTAHSLRSRAARTGVLGRGAVGEAGEWTGVGQRVAAWKGAGRREGGVRTVRGAWSAAWRRAKPRDESDGPRARANAARLGSGRGGLAQHGGTTAGRTLARKRERGVREVAARAETHGRDGAPGGMTRHASSLCAACLPLGRCALPYGHCSGPSCRTDPSSATEKRPPPAML